MMLSFEKKFVVIDQDDNTEWILDAMEIYEPVHQDTSFNIRLYQVNVSEEAEARIITYYPMLESVKEALAAQDLLLKE